MEYTLNDLQFIYNNDPLHIHVDMNEDGELFLKKKLKYELGEYPTRFACSICGGESELVERTFYGFGGEKIDSNFTYLDYDGGIRICNECLANYKKARLAAKKAENEALVEEWIATRPHETLDEVGPLDEDEWEDDIYND